ncbi:uncharacterized protein B0T23DRAFT_312840 [Neurospora hispaniola]|uniref:Single-strand DNA deaminase toxin A-like C-terminal domain-containing protein n=1 Tax=Neurospora hispaniola TaxID=588809 RepID=A0AAJ0I988_9PEZI|nr:hypothetical protein B0T23DRAFT_312840 [Neurospora hispaniola]
MKPSEFMTKALGLRTIHEAILEGDLKRVTRILHQDKSAVNTRTIRDQVTPLHLAVLNGSLATVKLLLLRKASFSIKDKKGYTARQYARSATIRAKKLKQYERLGWQPAKRRNRKARFISTIFREPEALRAILSANDHPLSGSTILTDGTKLAILQKVVTTSLTFPVQNSTCGFIASYMSSVPQMIAVSGWKGEGRSSTQGVLPNETMTALVRYACNIMGFRLYMQPYDCPGASVVPPEHVGRYMASHIEKQLSTAWVLKLLQDFLKTSDLARMGELKHIKLPTERSEAKIFLNHNPCGSCLGYLAKIRRVTGVTFAVETIPFAVPGSRAKSTPIPPSGARNSAPAAEAETDIVERDNDYGELCRQQKFDEDGPMDDFGSLASDEDNELQDELPVEPRADDEDQVEMQEEFIAPIKPKTATEPTRRQVVASRRLQGLLGTSPPGHWEVFQGQNFCAKPLKGARKRLGLNQEEFNQFLEAQSPRRFLGSPRATTISSVCASLLEPVSTINGRSVYFQTPVPVSAPSPATALDPSCLPSIAASVQGPPVQHFKRLDQTVQQSSSPPPRLEVCLPRLDSSERSQHRMIPDDEPKQLNLKRFSYRGSAHHKDVYPHLFGPPASSHLFQRLKVGQSKGLQASSTLSLKSAIKDASASTRKPSIAEKHIRPSKIRRIQERSVFAKVVRQCQENRQHQQQANSQQRDEHELQQQKYVKESMQHGGHPVTSKERSPDDTGSRQVLKSIERAVSAAPSRDGLSLETPIYLE